MASKKDTLHTQSSVTSTTIAMAGHVSPVLSKDETLRRRVTELEKALEDLSSATAKEKEAVLRYREDRSVLNELTYRRFLVARDLDVAKAKTMLIKHLAWRVSFGYDNILQEDFQKHEEAGYMYQGG